MTLDLSGRILIGQTKVAETRHEVDLSGSSSLLAERNNKRSATHVFIDARDHFRESLQLNPDLFLDHLHVVNRIMVWGPCDSRNSLDLSLLHLLV